MSEADTTKRIDELEEKLAALIREVKALRERIRYLEDSKHSRR